MDYEGAEMKVEADWNPWIALVGMASSFLSLTILVVAVLSSRKSRTSEISIEEGTDAGFDLERVASAMEAALAVPDRVLLTGYLESYRQLNRLFPKLGFLFGFIYTDIADKVDRLEAAVGSGDPDADVSTALLDGVNERPAKDSPTVAFIRLHRAFEFIARVVGDTFAATDDQALGPIVRTAYDETLGRYHNLFTRKACHVAFKTLGKRREFGPILQASRSREEAGPIVDRVITAAIDIRARLQPTIDANPLLRDIAQQ